MPVKHNANHDKTPIPFFFAKNLLEVRPVPALVFNENHRK